MAEVNLLIDLPQTKRNYEKRASEKTEEDRLVARRFDQDFFDGNRRHGYGGYNYDGRWKPVVKRMIEHYGLEPDARILDIGCAKGFLLHDFKNDLPRCEVAGIDVSKYAIQHSMDSVRPNLLVGSCESLPYPDNSFDLVISINTIHNLDLEGVKHSLKEVERVSKGNSFVTLDAWRTDEEYENLMKWVLTAETMLHVDEWMKVFDEVGYTGDAWWFIAE